MNREFNKEAVLALIEEKMNHYDEYEDAKEFNVLYDICKAISEMEVNRMDNRKMIYLDDAIDAIYERIRQIGYEHNASVLSIRQAILDLPPAQPEQRWIPVTERLPKENVYVLVWCGEVRIARIIRGISKEQRVKMQEGTIDDPVSYGWNLSNGYFKIKRSESYRTCDENGNNKVPYCWDCIYGEMFGQDVKFWMPLPEEPYEDGELDGRFNQ